MYNTFFRYLAIVCLSAALLSYFMLEDTSRSIDSFSLQGTRNDEHIYVQASSTNFIYDVVGSGKVKRFLSNFPENTFYLNLDEKESKWECETKFANITASAEPLFSKSSDGNTWIWKYGEETIQVELSNGKPVTFDGYSVDNFKFDLSLSLASGTFDLEKITEICQQNSQIVSQEVLFGVTIQQTGKYYRTVDPACVSSRDMCVIHNINYYGDNYKNIRGEVGTVAAEKTGDYNCPNAAGNVVCEVVGSQRIVRPDGYGYAVGFCTGALDHNVSKYIVFHYDYYVVRDRVIPTFGGLTNQNNYGVEISNGALNEYWEGGMFNSIFNDRFGGKSNDDKDPLKYAKFYADEYWPSVKAGSNTGSYDFKPCTKWETSEDDPESPLVSMVVVNNELFLTYCQVFRNLSYWSYLRGSSSVFSSSNVCNNGVALLGHGGGGAMATIHSVYLTNFGTTLCSKTSVLIITTGEPASMAEISVESAIGNILHTRWVCYNGVDAWWGYLPSRETQNDDVPEITKAGNARGDIHCFWIKLIWNMKMVTIDNGIGGMHPRVSGGEWGSAVTYNRVYKKNCVMHLVPLPRNCKWSWFLKLDCEWYYPEAWCDNHLDEKNYNQGNVPHFENRNPEIGQSGKFANFLNFAYNLFMNLMDVPGYFIFVVDLFEAIAVGCIQWYRGTGTPDTQGPRKINGTYHPRAAKKPFTLTAHEKTFGNPVRNGFAKFFKVGPMIASLIVSFMLEVLAAIPAWSQEGNPELEWSWDRRNQNIHKLEGYVGGGYTTRVANTYCSNARTNALPRGNELSPYLAVFMAFEPIPPTPPPIYGLCVRETVEEVKEAKELSEYCTRIMLFNGCPIANGPNSCQALPAKCFTQYPVPIPQPSLNTVAEEETCFLQRVNVSERCVVVNAFKLGKKEDQCQYVDNTCREKNAGGLDYRLTDEEYIQQYRVCTQYDSSDDEAMCLDTFMGDFGYDRVRNLPYLKPCSEIHYWREVVGAPTKCTRRCQRIVVDYDFYTQKYTSRMHYASSEDCRSEQGWEILYPWDCQGSCYSPVPQQGETSYNLPPINEDVEGLPIVLVVGAATVCDYTVNKCTTECTQGEMLVTCPAEFIPSSSYVEPYPKINYKLPGAAVVCSAGACRTSCSDENDQSKNFVCTVDVSNPDEAHVQYCLNFYGEPARSVDLGCFDAMYFPDGVPCRLDPTTFNFKGFSWFDPTLEWNSRKPAGFYKNPTTVAPLSLGALTTWNVHSNRALEMPINCLNGECWSVCNNLCQCWKREAGVGEGGGCECSNKRHTCPWNDFLQPMPPVYDSEFPGACVQASLHPNQFSSSYDLLYTVPCDETNTQRLLDPATFTHSQDADTFDYDMPWAYFIGSRVEEGEQVTCSPENGCVTKCSNLFDVDGSMVKMYFSCRVSLPGVPLEFVPHSNSGTYAKVINAFTEAPLPVVPVVPVAVPYEYTEFDYSCVGVQISYVERSYDETDPNTWMYRKLNFDGSFSLIDYLYYNDCLYRAGGGSDICLNGYVASVNFGTVFSVGPQTCDVYNLLMIGYDTNFPITSSPVLQNEKVYNYF